MTNKKLHEILFVVQNKRGVDFTGYRLPMLERRINKRLIATRCNTYNDYLTYLNLNTDELDKLTDVFTINVSHFFRNSLSFEYIKKIILPELLLANKDNNSIRIWSAGCSFGEEPYSIAILLNEILEKEELQHSYIIYATDLDKKAIDRAVEGSYNFESIKNVKYGLLNKYFKIRGDKFNLNPAIKEKVKFSYYDLLNKNSTVPPESIYGNFDLVLCRNVLIYFNQEPQQIILNKLYKSLNKNGIIVLGESEVPSDQFKTKLKRVSDCCNIYRKIG